jgi:hypothetical protein
MGKNRLQQINAKFPDNGEMVQVQANSHDAMFEYERAQKIVVKSKKYQTRAMRYVRKGLRRFRKEMERGQKQYEKIHGKLMLFGYWKYWFTEGKIGPEEDNEANLIHA